MTDPLFNEFVFHPYLMQQPSLSPRGLRGERRRRVAERPLPPEEAAQEAWVAAQRRLRLGLGGGPQEAQEVGRRKNRVRERVGVGLGDDTKEEGGSDVEFQMSCVFWGLLLYCVCTKSIKIVSIFTTRKPNPSWCDR